MATAPNRKKRRTVGRPRVSNLTRTEQLRLAKRAQRERDALAGQTEVRIKLPKELARRLIFASRRPGFVLMLNKLLDSEIVEVQRYPKLELLCWNRRDHFLSAQDARSLYERNWRFVDSNKLEPLERQLINSLSDRFGGGLRHG